MAQRLAQGHAQAVMPRAFVVLLLALLLGLQAVTTDMYLPALPAIRTMFHIWGWWGWGDHFREIVAKAGIPQNVLDFGPEWAYWSPVG